MNTICQDYGYPLPIFTRTCFGGMTQWVSTILFGDNQRVERVSLYEFRTISYIVQRVQRPLNEVNAH